MSLEEAAGSWVLESRRVSRLRASRGWTPSTSVQGPRGQAGAQVDLFVTCLAMEREHPHRQGVPADGRASSRQRDGTEQRERETGSWEERNPAGRTDSCLFYNDSEEFCSWLRPSCPCSKGDIQTRQGGCGTTGRPDGGGRDGSCSDAGGKQSGHGLIFRRRVPCDPESAFGAFPSE